MVKGADIARIGSLDKEEFLEEYYLQKPVILESLAKEWPATKLWSPEFFVEKFGDCEVLVQVAEGDHGSDYGAIDVTFERTRIRDYVAQLGQPGTGYWCVYPILRQFPCLASHLGFPNFEEPGVELSISHDFFFGGPGALTPLHYDLLENLFFQAYGTKRFIIVDPEFTESCYPENRTWIDGYSEVDISDLDYEQFPKFREVPVTEITISAGEIMYIPGGWWHAVQAPESNISINKWWGPPEYVEKNRQHLLDPNGMAPYVYDITPKMIVTELPG